MMKFILTGTTICTVLLANGAAASETENMRAEDIAAKDMEMGVKCLPAKKIIKLMRKFDGIKPEKKDTVNAFPEMRLTANDAGALPDRVYFREGTTEHKFNMDKDGVVTDFARIGAMHKKGELCMQGQQFIGKAQGTSGISLSMDFTIRFKSTSGEHSMAELIDGTKDGKSHYKKLFPGPMSIMVPKMTHIGVNFLEHNKTIKPNIYALKAGEKIDGLRVEKFGAMFVIGIENLQNLGADSLRIEGGDYHLTPIPSIEKMKKFGFGEGGEEEESEAKDD